MDEDRILGELLLRARKADGATREEIRQEIKELVLASPRFQQIIDTHAADPERPEAEFAVADQPSEEVLRRMLAGDVDAKDEFFRRCRDELQRGVAALREGRLDVNEPASDPVIDMFLRKAAEVDHLRS